MRVFFFFFFFFSGKRADCDLSYECVFILFFGINVYGAGAAV